MSCELWMLKAQGSWHTAYGDAPNRLVGFPLQRMAPVRLAGWNLPGSAEGDGIVPDAETSDFRASFRKSKVCAEAYPLYAAQGNLQIDARIAENRRFWTGTD